MESPVQPSTTLKRTPFYDFHRALGGKMVEFAGFEMPVRYTGDVREHVCVRERAGLFDISHMGEFHVEGRGALEGLDHAITNAPASAVPRQAGYSPRCRPDRPSAD